LESLGIAIGLLGGLVGAPVFCFALVKVIRPLATISRISFWFAIVLLSLFLLEVGLVLSLGVIGARELVGPAFFILHAGLTFSIAPALACALLLGRRSIARLWFVAAAVCWVVGGGAIFYQYEVAETLYGVDGMDGPYQAPF
jgi:hypothetical protein